MIPAPPTDIPAQPLDLPDPLIPRPKVDALMALAHAGVPTCGLRRAGREILGLSAAQMEVWLRLNGESVRIAAAFFNRGA